MAGTDSKGPDFPPKPPTPSEPIEGVAEAVPPVGVAPTPNFEAYARDLVGKAVASGHAPTEEEILKQMQNAGIVSATARSSAPVRVSKRGKKTREKEAADPDAWLTNSAQVITETALRGAKDHFGGTIPPDIEQQIRTMGNAFRGVKSLAEAQAAKSIMREYAGEWVAAANAKLQDPPAVSPEDVQAIRARSRGRESLPAVGAEEAAPVFAPIPAPDAEAAADQGQEGGEVAPDIDKQNRIIKALLSFEQLPYDQRHDPDAQAKAFDSAFEAAKIDVTPEEREELMQRWEADRIGYGAHAVVAHIPTPVTYDFEKNVAIVPNELSAKLAEPGNTDLIRGIAAALKSGPMGHFLQDNPDDLSFLIRNQADPSDLRYFLKQSEQGESILKNPKYANLIHTLYGARADYADQVSLLRQEADRRWEEDYEKKFGNLQIVPADDENKPEQPTRGEWRSQMSGMLDAHDHILGSPARAPFESGQEGGRFGNLLTRTKERGAWLGDTLAQLGVAVKDNALATVIGLGSDATSVGKGLLRLDKTAVGAWRGTKAGIESAKDYATYFKERREAGDSRSKILGESLVTAIEGYNKLPMHRKLEVTGALIGLAALTGAAGLGATSVALTKAMFGQRAIAGVGFAINRSKDEFAAEWSNAAKYGYAAGAGLLYSATTMVAGRWATDHLKSVLGYLMDHQPAAAGPAAVPVGINSGADTLTPPHAGGEPVHASAPPNPVPKELSEPQHEADVKGWKEFNPGKQYPGDATAEANINQHLSSEATVASKPSVAVTEGPATEAPPAASSSAAPAGPGAGVPVAEAAANAAPIGQPFDLNAVIAHAATGKGYEYDLKHGVWEQLRKGLADGSLKPEDYAPKGSDKPSDLYQLLMATDKNINGVVNTLAKEHGFLNADGTSATIGEHAQMTMGKDGSILFGQNPEAAAAPDAPAGAPTTPAYHPELHAVRARLGLNNPPATPAAEGVPSSGTNTAEMLTPQPKPDLSAAIGGSSNSSPFTIEPSNGVLPKDSPFTIEPNQGHVAAPTVPIEHPVLTTEVPAQANQNVIPEAGSGSGATVSNLETGSAFTNARGITINPAQPAAYGYTVNGKDVVYVSGGGLGDTGLGARMDYIQKFVAADKRFWGKTVYFDDPGSASNDPLIPDIGQFEIDARGGVGLKTGQPSFFDQLFGRTVQLIRPDPNLFTTKFDIRA